MRKVFPILLFLTFINTAFSQESYNTQNKTDLSFTFKPHFGFIVPHNKPIEYIVTGHIYGFECIADFRKNDDTLWNRLYNNPYTGIGIFYINLNNPDVLGNAIAVYPSLCIPYTTKNKFISMQSRIGIGMGYINKIYNPETNYMNLAMGTTFNVFVRLNTELRFKITDRMSILSDVGFAHMSNGRMGLRNLGINLFTYSAGIQYKLIQSTLPLKRIEKTVFKKDNNIFITAAGAIKSESDYNNNFYGAASLNTEYGRTFSPRSRFLCGADIFYDKSISVRASGDSGSYLQKDLYRVGLHAGHELIYRKVGVVTELGYYIYARYISHGALYSRLGIRYHVTDKLYFNVSLKAHKAIADFVEWGVGVRL